MTTSKTIDDRAIAEKIEAEAKAALPTARVRRTVRDAMRRLPSGEYSDELYDVYSVEVSIRDDATGNGETRVIDEADADVAAICKEMVASLKNQAKRTRRNKATMRAMDQE